MLLITKTQRDLLTKQGRATVGSGGEDLGHRPVVKLFNPTGAATWLLSELDPDDPDHAFGLCDLGFGEPEIGWVSLAELASVRGRFGLGIERDLHFQADKPLLEYWREARAVGRITA